MCLIVTQLYSCNASLYSYSYARKSADYRLESSQRKFVLNLYPKMVH